MRTDRPVDAAANAVPESLRLRHQGPPGALVVIRLGARTLDDDKLAQQCERTRGRWGFDGFSVFEVPAGDYALLARLVPIVALRPKLFRAEGDASVEAGFPLFPTADFPHWTVVLSQATSAHFGRVRALFSGPLDKPGVGREEVMDTISVVEPKPYDLAFDPNDVGPDSVVECWISQSPRADDDDFDPQPGDEVTAGDDEGAPLPGRVIRREGNRVWVQLDLTRAVHAAV